MEGAEARQGGQTRESRRGRGGAVGLRSDEDRLSVTLDVDRVAERVDPSARPIADWLVEQVRRDDEEAASADPSDLTELAADCDLEEAWSAVRAVHRELDDVLASGGDPPAVRESRRSLTKASRRLVSAYLRSDLRDQRRMLRDISHDIRTPLNSILFLTDGLFNENSGTLTEVQKRQLGIVYSAAASLLNFVNDLLDFARMGEDEDEAEGVAEVPFSLRGVCSDVTRLVEPLVEHRDTDFDVRLHASDIRRGDPQLLCRVLVNLLSNGIEAAGNEGIVRLDVDEADDDPDRLEVLVADDCFSSDIERIRAFLEPRSERELTQMLHGRTHGLGLHICSRLVRAAGGEISVDQRDGGGSCFVIQLPFPRDD